MKLTKGKISKLLNKNRQSKKKYRKNKKTKKNSYTNTFRKKKHLNLANKTLKQFKVRNSKGGELKQVGTEITTQPTQEVPITVNPIPQIQETTPIPEIQETQLNENPLPITTDPVETQPSQPAEPVPDDTTSITQMQEPKQPETTELDAINPFETQPSEPIKVEPDDTTTSPLIQETPDQVETNSKLMETGTNNVTPEITNIPESTENTTTFQQEEPTIAEPNVVTNEITNTEPELPENVSESLNTVISYLTNEISNQISNNISNNNNNNNNQPVMQNGYNSNEQAVEIMANSNGTTGGNKRKKFRLTKKSRKSPKSRSK